MAKKQGESIKSRNISRRVARIREVLDEVGELDDVGDHFENAKTLLSQLKTGQRRAIMESALTSHLEVEDQQIHGIPQSLIERLGIEIIV